jgi:hypothetical protein
MSSIETPGDTRRPTLRVQRRRCSRQTFSRTRTRSRARVYARFTDEAALDKFTAALVGSGRQVQVSRRRATLRASLTHKRALKCDLSIDISQARLGGVDICLGLRQARAIIGVVDAKEDIARLDGLIVADLDVPDVTGDSRGD